mgnify:CR=1 FL=1|tara:strand:- start:11 stop:595 length:585 start_codon:yes stop_codon:yes gene_type:complete
MASLTVNDIQDHDAAYEFALERLAYLIKDVLPNRKIIRADRDISVPVDPYITIRPMVVSGFNPSEYGNDPFDRIEDEAGNEYDLFQWKIVCDVKTYKGNAFTDLIKVRHTLKHRVKHEEFFGKYKTVGVGAVSTIANSFTPIDNQEMEAGASTRITLHYICKALDDSFGVIETIEGVVKNGDESLPFSITGRNP